MEREEFVKSSASRICNPDFESDLMDKLKDPEFAFYYLMSSILDKGDTYFLRVALGDIAKAQGVAKLSEKTGISRLTLYKIFDKRGNPSFDLVMQVLDGLGMQISVQPQKLIKRSKAS